MGATKQRRGKRVAVMRASRWVAAAALTLAALAALSSAVADPPVDPKRRAKASSFAPHHTKRHVYGAPIAKPILHKGKKPTPPASGTSTAAPPSK